MIPNWVFPWLHALEESLINAGIPANVAWGMVAGILSGMIVAFVNIQMGRNN